MLLPRAALARDLAPDGLRVAGWTVDVVEAYRTVAVPLSDEQLETVASADAVTFPSPSSVRNLVAAAGIDNVPSVVASIEPVDRGCGPHLGFLWSG